MFILGCILVLITLFLLIKRYEARMVLVAAGIVMCDCAGNQMAALNYYAKGLFNCFISFFCFL